MSSSPPPRWQMIAGASIGNALEFYDFVIYGYFAKDIAATFFPGQTSTDKLLLTFATFGVSFLARPVGAFILGQLADQRGRKFTMILAVVLMTIGSALIALMPSRAAIGLIAPFGILVARLIQGFALGGEFGSATALMIEHSKGSESNAASWQGTSQNIAGLIGSGFAFLLSLMLAPEAFHGYGFRLAFGLGVLAGPVALVLRRRLEEAPAFLALKANPHPPSEAAEPTTLPGIAIAACLVAIGTAQTDLVLYLPTYAETQLHMAAGKALGSVVVLYIFTLALVPVRLAIAARFDRSANTLWMVLSCIAMMATGYPAFIALTHFPGAVMLFLIPMFFTVISLPYNSPLTGFMGRVFPIRHRGIGLSVGYSLGIALFGGFAPYINTWLVAHTDDSRAPGYYLAFTSIVTIAAIHFARARLPASAP